MRRMPTSHSDSIPGASAPGKTPDIAKIAQHYAAIIEEIGGDLNSEAMRDTPRRAAKAIVEMTEGSRMGTERLLTMFKAECTQAVCHDMVIVEGVHEVGLCEHHLLPIIMSITIAYIVRSGNVYDWPSWSNACSGGVGTNSFTPTRPA